MITLSIIGVVTALTIPTFIVKNQEKETVVRLKKVYNTLSSAMSLALLEYGTPDNWNLVALDSPVGAQNAMDRLGKFLNISKMCGPNPGCMPKGYVYRLLDGTGGSNADDNNLASRAILGDGTIIQIRSTRPSCENGHLINDNDCFEINIDINGAKGPNVFGKDFFDFYGTKKGIVPKGSAAEIPGNFNDVKNCHTSGHNCTAWILYKENLDYINRNVSWDK